MPLEINTGLLRRPRVTIASRTASEGVITVLHWLKMNKEYRHINRCMTALSGKFKAVR